MNNNTSELSPANGATTSKSCPVGDISFARSVSDFKEEDLESFHPVHGHDLATIKELGIELHGSRDCRIFVQDPTAPVGRIIIHNHKPGNIFVFGRSKYPPRTYIVIRAAGANTRVFFPQIVDFMRFHDIYLRSSNQTFYVGPKTTVVGCRAEIEGEGRSVVIGDDCMFSDEINIRNYDMHTVFDVESGAILNRPPKDLVIDKHVWIGYRALILAPERIGRGSIVGASSLANKPIEPFSLAVGAPAKIAKRGVSWSRPVNHVEPRDLQFAREESARLS